MTHAARITERGEPMPLPPELIEHPDDTTVIGDIDAFIEYLESGQALRDWNERLAATLRELEEIF
jgi:hypothetical protein